MATWFGLFVTFATLNLILLGYGHDLMYLATVSLSPEELQRAPLDFLLRSWHPLSYWMTRINGIFTLEFHVTMWESIWWGLLPAMLSLPLISAFLGWTISKNLAQRSQKAGRQQTAWTTGLLKAAQSWNHQWRVQRARRWGYAGWLFGPVVFGVATLFTLGIWLVSGVVILPIVFSAYMGTASGAIKAQQELIAPLRCVGDKAAAGEDRQRQVRCLKVLRHGNEVARGYLIHYGAGKVFLYQPCVRQPISVSLEQTVVAQIDTLGIAGPGKNCRPQLSDQKPVVTGVPVKSEISQTN